MNWLAWATAVASALSVVVLLVGLRRTRHPTLWLLWFIAFGSCTLLCALFALYENTVMKK